MALWSGLLVAYNMGLNGLSIFGDSKIIIDVVTGKVVLSSLSSQGWLIRTKQMWMKLHNLPIQHIFRENKSRADGLSKKGLRLYFGILQVEHFRNGIVYGPQIS